MVGCAGECHRKQDRIETGKPTAVHIRKCIFQSSGQNTVTCVEEHIARDKRDPAVDHRRHITHTKDLCPADIKILCQKHDRDADNVDCDHEQNSKFQ